MESYRDAKLKLLDGPGLEFVVFNADDSMAEAILRSKRPEVAPIGFSVKGNGGLNAPLVSAMAVEHKPEGMRFSVTWQEQSAMVEAPVFGDFNVENLTATLTVLIALGWSLADAAAALRRVRAVPGRMESVTMAGRGAVVDYAHTPDALANVLSSMRKHCAGRLWVVFGCGGDRDKGKRPEMGAVADRLADVIVITDDNPRDEDGDAIIYGICEGISRRDVVVLRDRRAAINHVLEHAGPGDLVLVAGKGHETTQEILGCKHPFSDRMVVSEALSRLQREQAV
jgi:UDP-N-acetylmuramoyl-L-alanyl-D-glutamate--2,6-diaminopimelate ligase